MSCRVHHGLLGLVLLTTLAGTMACERGAAPPPAAPVPPATRGYVVVSIDTLRADHLGCYGYPKPTTPFLDQLASRATLFEEAYAQYPSTLISHATMFTGLHPREHGVGTPDAAIPDGIETLPEVFQRHGFRTAGFTEGGYVSGRFGFRRGFDEFVARDRSRGREVQRTFARGARFLAGLDADDRFLLFLHTYAVHAPYDAPERYQALFWPGEPPAGAFFPGARALSELDARGAELSPQVVEWLQARYDAGIRETDELLRGFFAELERLGLDDETTVVITADHGEEFLEHGRLQHSQLYREVLRVPLLVAHPAVATAARQRSVVELADLAPTLYQLARLTPGGAPSGVSFASLLGHPGPAPDAATAFADGPRGDRALYRAGPRGVDSLLLFDPPAEAWVGRSLIFDARPPELSFQARTRGEKRRLTVHQGQRELATVELTSDWQPVRVPLPREGTRVRLEVEECTLEGAPSRDYTCYGFQLRGLRPARVELFELASDPGQERDLSRQRTADTRALLRELLTFRPSARGEAMRAPLEPEVLESLRALGYLQ